METKNISSVTSQIPPSAFFPTVSPTRPPRAQAQQARPEEPMSVPTREETQGEVNRLNKILDGLGSRLEFGVFEGGPGKQFFVRLVDKQSDSVVKTMPPEHVMEMRKRIHDAVGFILDEVR